MPTLFYQIYGTYDLSCSTCVQHNVTHFGNHTFGNGTLSCGGCTYVEKNIYEDPIYLHKARPLMYACAAILPLAYLVGLIFTLKTHAYLYEEQPTQEDDDETPSAYQDEKKEKGHGSSEWSLVQSVIILVIATLFYAAVAEVMTRAITPALVVTGISEQFAGLTIIGVLGNTAEFINAIQFALQNNITLRYVQVYRK
jgi:Ca2+:H+ antiporter